MKKTSLAARLCFGISALAVWLAASPASASPPAGYYLVWDDEFNGTSLNPTNWDYWLLGSRRDAINVTNAVSVSGGYLTITTYTSNSVNYTAMVATDSTFRSRYGYWETSIQWGDTNGMWSAMWLQSPTMGAYLYDPFVSGSEIDVAEHRSTDGGSNGDIINVVQPNVHWDGYGSAAESSGGNNYGSGLGSGFHTYGFQWTPANYTIYIDGSNVRNWNYSQNTVPVSLSTEWFILSSEVQSNLWAGNIPASGYGSLAASTTKLTVDYARYYAPTTSIFWTGNSSADLTSSNNYATNMPPLATSDVQFSMLSGNNLSPTLGKNLTLDSLVFTWMNNGLTLGGTNTLTLEAGGIDMISADHSVTLNCPINIGAAQTWNVGPNSPGNILTVNGAISGSATLSKGSYGTVVLAGTNSFTGILSAGTGSTTANDGVLQLASSGAAASAASISIPNNNSGSSTLQVNGGINVTPPITLNGRNTNVAAIENVSGSNTLAGGVTINIGGGYYLFQSDAGTLNLAGTISSAASGARTLTFQGAGQTLVSGKLANGSATVNVNEAGAGTLTLVTTNTYTGTTTFSSGTIQINSPSALGPPPAAFNSSQLVFNGGALEALATLALNDGNRGLTIASNSSLIVDPGATLTISNTISGAGNLTKTSAGTLILNGANPFAGALNVDSASTTANDGIVRIASPNALANAVSPISIADNNTATSTLQLDGSAGNITLAQSFGVYCRASTTAPTIENLYGSNQLSGPIWLNVGGSYFNVQSDAGLLTLSGTNQYVGTLTGGRSYQFLGAGNCLVTGPILNSTNGAPISLVKNGSGTLTLAGTNTYGSTTTVNSGTVIVNGQIGPGAVTVNGGTLCGNGTLSGPLTVESGAALAPGTGIGTLTAGGSVTLEPGANVLAALNPALGANSQLRVTGTLNYGGTLTVTNLGGALAAGEAFQIFSAKAYAGSFSSYNLPPLGTNLVWNTGTLSNGVLTVAYGSPSPQVNAVSLAGNNLIFAGSGGAAYSGFSLLSSTNLANPWTNWILSGSGVCDGLGNFMATNAAGSAANFYLIRVP